MENSGLPENQVDVWQVDLVQPPEIVQRCRRVLSLDEVQRADRFHFDKHRSRFTVARAAMREILGRYAGAPPAELVFFYGEKGKPGPSGVLEERALCFNLSHSHEIALLAVSRGLTVGIDVERINPEFSSEEIAERFFSAAEVRCLMALPQAVRSEAFFSCWTRKEAYIKALGEGLSVPLDSFEVAFAPGFPAALLQVRVDPHEVTRWSMYDLEITEGYKAALVVEGKGHHLRRSLWTAEKLS